MNRSRRNWLLPFAPKPQPEPPAERFSLERFYAERKASGADREALPERGPRVDALPKETQRD